MNPADIIDAGAKVVALTKELENLLPTLEEQADVVAYGNNNASRNDLYWLCVCVAMGLVRNKDLTKFTLPKGFIALEYNCEQNYARFTCRQISSWKGTLNWMNKNRGFGRRNGLALFTGPQDNCVGGDWQWFTVVADGLPGKRDMQNLGWEFREVLTQNPVYKDKDGNLQASQNPVPPGDEQSRGDATIASNPQAQSLAPDLTNVTPEYLLFELLSGPCDAGFHLPTPPNNEVPLDVRLHRAGNSASDPLAGPNGPPPDERFTIDGSRPDPDE